MVFRLALIDERLKEALTVHFLDLLRAFLIKSNYFSTLQS